MSRSVFPYKAIQPCLPRPAKEPPTGPEWIHEIKHDGFRILARRDGKSVRLYTRNGYNFADRFREHLNTHRPFTPINSRRRFHCHPGTSGFVGAF